MINSLYSQMLSTFDSACFVKGTIGQNMLECPVVSKSEAKLCKIRSSLLTDIK